MNREDKIYIAGHMGMVGSAIHRNLKEKGYNNFLLQTSSELDLRSQDRVHEFIADQKPDHVILAAAKVGGIHANDTYRADFFYDNIMIQTNVIHASFEANVKKLLFLGSSCIYPRLADQPITEDSLLTGKLEPTNEPYAISKIAGIKMCDAYRAQHGCNYISAMPTNLYGPNDNYDLENSHVLPALLRKFIVAERQKSPTVILWGTGKPRREFMHVDDMAEAAFFLMRKFDEAGHINVGTGSDISILELAQLIKKVTGYTGEIVHDTSKPDGMMRKRLDVSKINDAGWSAKIKLEDGVKSVYEEIKEKDF